MRINALLLVALAMISVSCSRTETPTDEARKLNPAAAPTSTVGSGDATADDPKSGLNTSRPDASKDLKSP